MKRVNIYLEKKVTRKFTLNVTDEEYEAICTDGECPKFDELCSALSDDTSLDKSFDYAIIDDENGKILVDWN